MKAILRGYGVDMTSQERQIARAQATDMTKVRGTSQAPLPPRDLIAQSGPRGILVSWNLPDGFSNDIQSWRVYKDTETNLFAVVRDRGIRQQFIEATTSASPPTVNIFVSSVNTFGRESARVQVQAKAAAEAGAPPMPTPPPDTSGTDTGTGFDYLNFA